MNPRPRFLTIALVGHLAVDLCTRPAVNDDRNEPAGQLAVAVRLKLHRVLNPLRRLLKPSDSEPRARAERSRVPA